MSRTYVPTALRRFVRERARLRCEYCLIHEDDAAFRHEVDHIISEKHGGATTIDNLAYCCFLCNNHKGSDLASLSNEGVITRLFNPRTDDWRTHFGIVEDQIVARSHIGEATVHILALNSLERGEERRGLQTLNRFPNHSNQAEVTAEVTEVE